MYGKSWFNVNINAGVYHQLSYFIPTSKIAKKDHGKGWTQLQYTVIQEMYEQVFSRNDNAQILHRLCLGSLKDEIN